jgi:hypothetical protein
MMLTYSLQSAVNCHNKVSQFGERCKLCTVSAPNTHVHPNSQSPTKLTKKLQVMNEGRSASYEVISASNPYHDSYSSRGDSSREERRGRTRERKHRDMRLARTSS